MAASISNQLIAAARELSAQAGRLKFGRPVVCVYHPLAYAWKTHEEYLRRFGNGHKRVVFLGMNPGPYGMVQTGVPFGEVAAVRDWMKIRSHVERPASEHPKRPVLGFNCPRSEVSGRRLWGLVAERFGSPKNFFREHLVVNYCPLAFCEASGRNRTPDQLPAIETRRLFRICDEHLRHILEILQPEWLIGVGRFADERGRNVSQGLKLQTGQVLHPSPASPAANRGWEKAATRQLIQLGVWS